MTTQRTAIRNASDAGAGSGRDTEANSHQGPELGARPGTEWVHDAWTPPSRHRRSFVPRDDQGESLLDDEHGAVTAEYAIIIMAAVAFAGLLVAIMRSGEIRGMLVQLVENALSAAG